MGQTWDMLLKHHQGTETISPVTRKNIQRLFYGHH